jgi:thioredoxin 1
MKPFTFTDANFDVEALKSELPIVVDFWAEWCGPCRMIGPIMEELAESFDGKAKIGKLNVDENPQIAMKYGVRSIPTVLFIKNGEVVDKVIGAVQKSVFIEKLSSLVKQ